MNVSEKIKRCRNRLSLSQTELSKLSNLTPPAISQFESGTRKPSFESLAKLADALGVTTDYLVGIKRKNFDDILSDPKVAPMFKGFMDLSEEEKESVYLFYQFIKHKSGKES